MRSSKKHLVLLAIVLTLVLLMTSTASALTYHTVAPGDWLSRIAPTYGVTWQEIYEANTSIIKDPDLIYPGQKLVIPDKEAPAATATPVATPAATPTPVVVDIAAANAKLAALAPTDEAAGMPDILLHDTVLADTLLTAMKTAAGTDLAAISVPMGITATGYRNVLELYPSTELATVQVTGKELLSSLRARFPVMSLGSREMSPSPLARFQIKRLFACTLVSAMRWICPNRQANVLSMPPLMEKPSIRSRC